MRCFSGLISCFDEHSFSISESNSSRLPVLWVVGPCDSCVFASPVKSLCSWKLNWVARHGIPCSAAVSHWQNPANGQLELYASMRWNMGSKIWIHGLIFDYSMCLVFISNKWDRHFLKHVGTFAVSPGCWKCDRLTLSFWMLAYIFLSVLLPGTVF